jgi:hypothetical protein
MTRRRPAAKRRPQGVRTLRARDVTSLRRQLSQRAQPATPRFRADPDDVQRSVARLVLTLVDFIRKLMERQAVRRMEEGTLSPSEIERMGRALMQLEKAVEKIAERFGLEPTDLNLDLGPLGRLT